MADTAVAPAERTLPHNLEAERSVLGAILVQNDAFNLAAQVIDSERLLPRRPPPHLRLHGRAQRAQRMRSTSSRSRRSCREGGNLDAVGGPAYVASLADGVPRATNVEYYARIVKEKSTLRNLIYAANKILTDAYEAEQESDLILDEAEGSIFAVADDRLKAGFVAMRDLVKENFPKIEQLFEQKRLITGVPTGLRRHRRDDARPAARRSGHRRGAPVDGEDQPRAQHRAVRGRAAQSDGRLLQPGNVEGVAVPAPAHVGGAHRQPPADERRHRPEGLRPHRARARDDEQHAAAHRRHRRHRRDGDARQGAAPARPSTA